MEVTVQFKCPSCERLFVSSTAFSVPFYNCDDCTAYWPKEDGRNCPQCHKFGRNPDMPVCEFCESEVEEFSGVADPDESDVINENGDEIISKRKAAMKKKERESAADWGERQNALRQQQQDVLDQECSKRGIQEQAFAGYVVSSQIIHVLGQPCTLRATVSVGFAYSDELPPFSLEYRFNVRSPSGGWEGDIVPRQTFEDIEELFAEADRRMAAPFDHQPR